MKRLPAILFAVLMSLSLWAKTDKQTVVFDVDIHCQGCIDNMLPRVPPTRIPQAFDGTVLISHPFFAFG